MKYFRKLEILKILTVHLPQILLCGPMCQLGWLPLQWNIVPAEYALTCHEIDWLQWICIIITKREIIVRRMAWSHSEQNKSNLYYKGKTVLFICVYIMYISMSVLMYTHKICATVCTHTQFVPRYAHTQFVLIYADAYTIRANLHILSSK